MPRKAAIDHVQVHVLTRESHDPDQPLPTIALVPADDNVFAGDLAAQFARAGLAPGLIFFGCVYPGESYPVVSFCDLEDDGVAVDDTDNLPGEVMGVSRVAADSD
jgi:hypothetical protein